MDAVLRVWIARARPLVDRRQTILNVGAKILPPGGVKRPDRWRRWRRRGYLPSVAAQNDTGEEVGEIGLSVDAVQLAAFDEAGKGRPSAS